MTRGRMMIMMAAAVGTDRLLKGLAAAGTDVQAGIFRFHLFRNDGLIFSIPSSGTLAIILMAAAMIVVAWIGVVAWRRHDARQLSGSLLILAGAASNLYDRLAHGFVIDWADFGPRWPIFNLADLMIAAGVVVYFWPARKLTTPA